MLAKIMSSDPTEKLAAASCTAVAMK